MKLPMFVAVFSRILSPEEAESELIAAWKPTHGETYPAEAEVAVDPRSSPPALAVRQTTTRPRRTRFRRPPRTAAVFIARTIPTQPPPVP